MKASLQNALQDQLDRSLLFTPVLGINVAIHDEEHGLWLGASGFSDPETRVEMPVEGRFYIYSITKTFTAVRILQMVETGQLLLDDPLTKWLPELPFPSSITLRRLLNHTSGIPDYTDLDAYMPAVKESPSIPWNYDKVIELTCHGELDFEPGTRWEYSNTGYMVLLKVIEIVTGETFTHTLHKHIFEPLELKHTYVAEDVDKGTLVPGFSRELHTKKLMENVIPKYHPGWCATGLVVSTTGEVVQFYEALFGGKLIGAKQLEAMHVAVPVGHEGPFFVKPCYGLGVMIDPESAHGEQFGHGGQGPGYNTWVMHLPNFNGQRLTMSVFCNTSISSHPFNLINDLLYVLHHA